MTRTPTMNVGVALVMARASVNNTMACRASTNRSVCPGIVSMDSVAATFAPACVTRVRKREKGRGTTEFAAR